MENTVLHQFINYHDQLITEMRKQIASLQQIGTSYHQLKLHREKMIGQMKSILNENKERIMMKQSDLEKLCEKIKSQSELFQQLKASYEQMKEEYQMVSKNQPVWESINHELSNDQKSCEQIIQDRKEKCEQNWLRIAEIGTQCCTNKQGIKALTVEVMLKQQEKECISDEYHQLSKYREQITKQIAIIDEFIEKESATQQKTIKMKGMTSQKTESLHQDLKEKEEILQNQKQKYCSQEKLKANLQNQRTHICGMLKSQQTISCNLTNTLNKAQKIAEFKLSELRATQKQLQKYLEKITKNNMRISQKQQFKAHLLNHIKSLHQANHLLRTQIEQSSIEDAKLTQILKFKDCYRNKENISNQNLAEFTKKMGGAFYETADDSQFSSASNFRDF